MTRPIAAMAAAIAIAAAAGAAAQQAGSPFGGFRHDSAAPIEITADSLEVRQAEGVAIFLGGVVAGQGTLRLTADRLEVRYAEGAAGGGGAAEGSGDIDSLRAEGEVFLTSGAETASGQWADYDVARGFVTMGGGVTLTQGDNAIRGERLSVDLNAGTGRIEGGRVQSVFTPAQGRP
jgi:lipopolysaccharide export system protein LptA